MPQGNFKLKAAKTKKISGNRTKPYDKKQRERQLKKGSTIKAPRKPSAVRDALDNKPLTKAINRNLEEVMKERVIGAGLKLNVAQPDPDAPAPFDGRKAKIERRMARQEKKREQTA